MLADLPGAVDSDPVADTRVAHAGHDPDATRAQRRHPHATRIGDRSDARPLPEPVAYANRAVVHTDPGPAVAFDGEDRRGDRRLSVARSRVHAADLGDEF